MFKNIPFEKMAGRGFRKVLGIEETKEQIDKDLKDLGLEKEGLEIEVEEGGNVKVSGEASSQEMKEKAILAIGNIFGIKQVAEHVKTKEEAPESQFHTVVSGDTLWKIAKKYYGNGSRYPEIFEANRPMLSHPDKIFVGQVLRIPVDISDDGVA